MRTPISGILKLLGESIYLLFAGNVPGSRLYLQEAGQRWHPQPGMLHCTCKKHVKILDPFTPCSPILNTLSFGLYGLCAQVYSKRKVSWMDWICVVSTQEYKLVITGHSLGAGTAALLAIMLRNSFPTLQCYAFSPPGGLLRYGQV